MRKLQYTFKSDILFKMTFVKYRDLLKCLVAAVLKIPVGDIQEFIILNSEIVPETIEKKFCRLDIHIKAGNQYIDVEMQISNEGNFAERLLVYWSKVFSVALGSGEDYKAVPRTILISFINFDMFECAEYCSEFVAMEKYRHEMLTDKMSIFVFELGKLPEEIDSSNMLELFLRLFKADTEEELEELEKLEVNEVTQMVNAYRDITQNPDYADLERKRVMARLDEGQAIRHALEQVEAKWQSRIDEQAAKISELEAMLKGQK